MTTQAIRPPMPPMTTSSPSRTPKRMSQSMLLLASTSPTFLSGRPLERRYLSILRCRRRVSFSTSAIFFALAIRIRASSVPSSMPDDAWPAGPFEAGVTLMKVG